MERIDAPAAKANISFPGASDDYVRIHRELFAAEIEARGLPPRIA